MTCRQIFAALAVVTAFAPSPARAKDVRRPPIEKTLVAWAAPANLTQQGGGTLTLQSGPMFDAIVLGEKARGKWMAGSNFFQRTESNQSQRAAETADAGAQVQIAIVYTADRVKIYRDGEPYADYSAQNIDLLSIENHVAVFGLRHLGVSGAGTTFAGAIDDARIYASALTPEQIKTLRPNEQGGPKPLAWWDFNAGSVKDRAGHFTHYANVGDVKLANGKLLLDGKAYLVAARSGEDAALAALGQAPRAPAGPFKPTTPSWPKHPPANWVTYHLAHPGPGDALPGDPNCAFDHQGKVHLHYIYRDETGFVFAHVSSDDMVRWTWRPTVLAPPTTGHGMFSGTGFYTKEGRPAIVYHGEGSGANWIQLAKGDDFNAWEKPYPIIPKNADGAAPAIRHWDPDLWLNGDTYYALSGGQNPQLMKSSDLKSWKYLGDLLHEDFPADLGVAKEEDISCANMVKIGDKWMLLCISHRLGCRYYLGGFKDEKFLPETHAMMSFGGNQFFAPESVLTRDGRRVMWAWIMNLPIAPTGVQSLPRELELPDDGVLRIRPLRELRSLRRDEKLWTNFVVADGEQKRLEGVAGDAVELEIKIAAPVPPTLELRMLGDDQGRDALTIATGAGRASLRVGGRDAPFELADGEDLTLRVFIDKNLVEVFVNDRQAVAHGHGTVREKPNFRVYAQGGAANVKSAATWQMKSIHTRTIP